MSTSAYNYVVPVNGNLVCCICRVPFIEPTSTTTCTHTFCLPCITEALVHSKQCPVDRSPLSADDLRPANTIIRSLVDELLVECPQRSFGCLYTGQRQLLESHLRKDCMFVQTQCCQEACGQTLLKKDATKHSENCVHRSIACAACGARIKFLDASVHRNHCPAQEATCSACTATFPMSDLETHNSRCPNVVIPCSFSSYGCTWQGPRSTLTDSHLPICPYQALQGFFAIYEAEMARMRQKSTEMENEINDLKKSLRSQQKDIDAAKTSLGPWFRPDGTLTPATTPTTERSVPLLDRPPRRRLSTPLAAGLFNFPLPDQEEHSNRQEAFNDPDNQSHLPPFSVEHPPLSGYPSSTFPDLMSTRSLPFFFSGDGTSSYPRASPQSQVAPINLHTTLEGSLSSLRNSIVTLAASLDSLSRRQDMTLTTETLRMHEEVGSLRAIVQGLRMQVHTVMMERNSQIMRLAASSPYSSSSPSNDSRPSIEHGFSSTVQYINHSMPMPSSVFNVQSTTSVRRAVENKL